MNEQRLKELARQLADRTAELHRERHRAPLLTLRIATPPPKPLDGAVRDSHLRVIRQLGQYADLQLLVDQATFGRGLERLSDDELITLHRDLERGCECIADDIGFIPAGLLRPRF